MSISLMMTRDDGPDYLRFRPRADLTIEPGQRPEWGRYRSLMGQGRRLDMSEIDAYGCLRSLRAHQALDGVSWVQSGSVEVAVGQTDRTLQNRRRHLLPPAGVAPLGSSVRPPLRLMLFGYAGLNSVPCW